jgi:hypothetical protein
MRYAEYGYLTLGLPLLVIRDIEKDVYHDEEIEIIKKGTIVYFSNFYEENILKIKLERTDKSIISVNAEDLNIDYNYVPFPYFSELEEVSDDNIMMLEKGKKLVSGDSDFYGQIGAGQIVDIESISINSAQKYIENIVLRDQFGNIFKDNNGELYIYDEAKLNRDPIGIIDPLQTIDDSTTFNFSSKDILLLSKLISSEIRKEHKGTPIFEDNLVAYALVNAFKEFRK